MHLPSSYNLIERLYQGAFLVIHCKWEKKNWLKTIKRKTVISHGNLLFTTNRILYFTIVRAFYLIFCQLPLWSLACNIYCPLMASKFFSYCFLFHYYYFANDRFEHCSLSLQFSIISIYYMRLNFVQYFPFTFIVIQYNYHCFCLQIK